MKLTPLSFMQRPFFIFLSLIFIASSSVYAKTLYVSDVLIISVRSGPGKSYKIIKTINSGTAMTVLEDQGEFIKIRTEENIEGWVPKFYTDSEIPKALVISQLQTELKRMESEAEKLALQKESLARNVQEFSVLKTSSELQVNELTQELTEIKEKYESIRVQSDGIIKTTQERDQLQQEVNRLTQKVNRIETENISLSDFKMIYWFLAGAGTFLMGWIIGKLSRKNQKRTLTI